MNRFKTYLHYFSRVEWIIWSVSILMVLCSFWISGEKELLTLFASLIGVTSLIFCAKGNPVGLILMILFSTVYAVISYFCAYYGELITYAGMTLPMSIVSLVSWLKNPYRGNKAEVKVNRLAPQELIPMVALALVVTFAFYFILRALGTESLIWSTISIATSFVAAYLAFRRSPFFSLAYAANDVILIILWILATVKDLSYLSVVICFAAFLINDIYGYISWSRMQKRQAEKES